MDLVLLKEFLTGYSLPTVIISIFVGTVSIIASKLLKGKLPSTFVNYATFFLAIILYFAYDMIFVIKAFGFSIDAFYAGILCGSLATVIVSAVNKIGRGEPLSSSAVRLLIEGIISGVVKKSSITATAAALEEILLGDNDDCFDAVKDLLTVNAEQVVEEQINATAKLIIDGVNALKS